MHKFVLHILKDIRSSRRFVENSATSNICKIAILISIISFHLFSFLTIACLLKHTIQNKCLRMAMIYVLWITFSPWMNLRPYLPCHYKGLDKPTDGHWLITFRSCLLHSSPIHQSEYYKFLMPFQSLSRCMENIPFNAELLPSVLGVIQGYLGGKETLPHLRTERL